MNPADNFRIAVDARPLCHPGTGIYRYTREMLLRMRAMGGRWYLYSPHAYNRDGLEADNIVHRSGEVLARIAGSQASQVLFPRWSRRDAVSIFWGPRHHLPVGLSAGIRTVLTVHDLVWQRQGASMRATRRWSERLLMPRSVARADAVVTGSNYIAKELAASFPDASSRIRVIPYASSFLPASSLTRDPLDKSRYFLFVGTMEPRKNLPRLLRAYKSYVGQVASPRLLKVVGGAGWGGIDPHNLVIALGLTDTVEVLGAITDEALAALYKEAFALVMPSLYEGFGLPVVEALAQGIPAIVSRETAPSEVAANAGYRVNPFSEEDICRALCRLSLEPDIYMGLRDSALPRAAEFSWDQSAAEMYALLRNISCTD